MLVLFLDAAVILGLTRYFTDDDTPGFGTAIGTAIVLALGFVFGFKFLGPYLGIFALLPMVLFAAAILWVTCDLPPKKALLAGVILLVYKIVLSLIISSLLA